MKSDYAPMQGPKSFTKGPTKATEILNLPILQAIPR